MIYVASPYSSPILGVAESRYRKVRDFVDLMLASGFVAFSPIVYCHPVSMRTGHQTDAQTWMHFNMDMLRRAEAMYVLDLPGWKESKGLKIELNVCKMLSIPVVHYNEKFELTTEEYNGALVGKF